MSHSAISGRGKILWVACDSLERTSKTDPRKSPLEEADTPNLDALCQLSETGLMTAGDESEFEEVEKFSELTRLRSLAITNRPSQGILEKSFHFDCYETVRRLGDFENVLEAEWESYDFFYLHLDGECETVRQICDPEAMEWIEMVEAWLPGMLGKFQPAVFALSGDLDAEVSKDDSILAMIHSPWNRPDSCERLSHRTARNGRLGSQMDVRQWLLLLMAHASR